MAVSGFIICSPWLFITIAVFIKPDILYYVAIYFDKLDFKNQQYQYTLQFGKDIRVSASSLYPSPGYRQLMQQTALSNALLRYANSSLSTSKITQTLRGFPTLTTSTFTYPFGGVIGGVLFPFGISFLLPVSRLCFLREEFVHESEMLTFRLLVFRFSR